jgi:hypothetical protein
MILWTTFPLTDLLHSFSVKSTIAVGENQQMKNNPLPSDIINLANKMIRLPDNTNARSVPRRPINRAK